MAIFVQACFPKMNPYSLRSASIGQRGGPQAVNEALLAALVRPDTRSGLFADFVLRLSC